MRQTIFLLAIFFSGGAFAESLSGNTLGAALANLSSLKSSVGRALTPEQTIGVEAAKSDSRLAKHLCSELGTQIGYAFGVQTSLSLHTSTLQSSDSPDRRALSEKNNALIDTLSAANNNFCQGPSNDKTVVRHAVKSAEKIADELSSMIQAFEKRMYPSGSRDTSNAPARR